MLTARRRRAPSPAAQATVRGVLPDSLSIVVDVSRRVHGDTTHQWAAAHLTPDGLAAPAPVHPRNPSERTVQEMDAARELADTYCTPAAVRDLLTRSAGDVRTWRVTIDRAADRPDLTHDVDLLAQAYDLPQRHHREVALHLIRTGYRGTLEDLRTAVLAAADQR